MTRIRVLVVDDSVVARRLVVSALSSAADIEIAGVASNGRAALARTAELRPDVIIMDLDMPELGGTETIRQLRQAGDPTPVIVYSTLSVPAAKETLEALSAGASDYVTKPSASHNAQEALARIRDQLLPRIRGFAWRKARPARLSDPAHFQPSAGSGLVEALVIGVSTGGPNALAELMPALGELPVPILLVQHMPAYMTRMFAHRLTTQCPYPVREAQSGEAVRPGTAYLAPGDQHLTLVREGGSVKLLLSAGPMENGCRPSVDPLFHSAAAVHGDRVLGLVLTGMGHDGLRGCQAIKRAGGQVFVQDEASSVVWGMPGAVAEGGLADRVLPLGQLPAAVRKALGLGQGPALVRGER